jgi:hypothetical protein
MADFPLRLEYNAGLENAPGDPFGRTELVVEANGTARLVHKHIGLARTWTGQVDVATLQTAWAALERGGFPEIPQHPVPGGSAMRTLIAHGADGAKRGGNIAWHAKLPGFIDAFPILDSIVRQLSEDTVKATPNTLPPVVTNIVRLTN